MTEPFGKQALYLGPMHGAGAVVFAVWGYVLAHVDRNSSFLDGAGVTLNPISLANCIGESADSIEGAIRWLRSHKDHRGRPWLVKHTPYYFRVDVIDPPPRARPKMGTALRAAVLERDGYVCGICGDAIEGDLHIDHVVPLARGGPHDLENLQPAHARCNLRKWAH